MRCFVYRGDWTAADLARNPLYDDVELVWGDLLDQASVDGAVRGVDCVFHLAGARVSGRVKDYDRVNVLGTANLVRACTAARVERFVHVSSISVHGHNASAYEPFDEHFPTRPATPYARSKLAGEQLVKAAAREGLPAVVLRPGPFYGPGQSAAIQRLMDMVRDGHAPHVAPSGLRSFTHVDNVADALIAAEASGRAAGEHYLIGDSRPYTTLELLQTMADAQSVPLRTWDIPGGLVRGAATAARLGARMGLNPSFLTTVGEYGQHSFCTISRAETELEYRPLRSLSDGMRDAVNDLWARARD